MQNVQAKAKDAAEPIVYVVDDDAAVREALLDLFLVANKRASAFPNGPEFLRQLEVGAPGCVVVDFQMPGGTGLNLQNELASLGSKLPVIFLTAHADVRTSVAAMKAGATDFITKPFANQDLLDAVDHAIRLDDMRREAGTEVDRIQGLVDTLTPREREVMYAVVSGLMNKQVAYQLGIREITVKLHRMSVMRKMQSRSLADLVRKVIKVQRVQNPA